MFLSRVVESFSRVLARDPPGETRVFAHEFVCFYLEARIWLSVEPIRQAKVSMKYIRSGGPR